MGEKWHWETASTCLFWGSWFIFISLNFKVYSGRTLLGEIWIILFRHKDLIYKPSASDLCCCIEWLDKTLGICFCLFSKRAVLFLWFGSLLMGPSNPNSWLISLCCPVSVCVSELTVWNMWLVNVDLKLPNGYIWVDRLVCSHSHTDGKMDWFWSEAGWTQ